MPLYASLRALCRPEPLFRTSLVLLTAFVATSAAADPEYDRQALEAVADSLGQPSYVVLSELFEIDLDYEEDDDVLEGSIEVTTVSWLRSSSALSMGRIVRFIEQPSYRMDDLEIRVYSEDGSKKSLDEGDLEWISRIPESQKIYYVDGEERIASIPELEVGDIVSQKLRFEIRDRHGFPCPVLGGENFLQSSLVVDFDDDLHLRHRVQGTDRAQSRLRHQIVDDDRQVWSFVPNATDKEQDRQLTIVLHGEHPEGGLAAAPTWERAGDAYLDLAEPRWAADDAIERRVESALTGVGSEPTERIDALYREVQKSCRYLGLYSGRGGIIPDPAAEVLEVGHSDCKGLGGLLIAMLREAGIEAHPILLLTAGQGRVEPDLPNLAQFDHFIVWANDGSEEGMWLDGTTDERPAGTLPWMDCVDSALLVRRGASRMVSMPEGMWKAGERRIKVEGQLDHIHRLDVVVDEQCEGEPALSRIWMNERLSASDQSQYFERLFQPPSHRMQIEARPVESIGSASFRLQARARSVSSLPSARGRVFLPAELVPIWVPSHESVLESVERGLLPFPDVDEDWSLSLPEGLHLSAPDSLEVEAGMLRCSLRSWQENGQLRLRRQLRWDESRIDDFDERQWKNGRQMIQDALSGHFVLDQREP